MWRLVEIAIPNGLLSYTLETAGGKYSFWGLEPPNALSNRILAFFSFQRQFLLFYFQIDVVEVSIWNESISNPNSKPAKYLIRKSQNSMRNVKTSNSPENEIGNCSTSSSKHFFLTQTVKLLMLAFWKFSFELETALFKTLLWWWCCI